MTTTWKKTTSYGDYSQTPDRVNRSKRNQFIISQARALRIAGKHAGSHRIETLLKGIKQAEYAKQN